MTTTRCKPWQGRINAFGYGTIGKRLAHRVAYESVHGPIPDGMTVDHTCHDPDVCRKGVQCPHRRCVNVEHMVLVTPDDNRRRKYHYSSLKTHCPVGHAYEGDNLAAWGGRRYCRTCRNESLKAKRRKAAMDVCRDKGHKRVEATGSDGRAYCTICASERGKQSVKGRSRDESGAFV